MRYTIDLEVVAAGIDDWWDWFLYEGTPEEADVREPLAWGGANTRWGALRQARRAARKHKKGKLPPPKQPKPNTVEYEC